MRFPSLTVETPRLRVRPAEPRDAPAVMRVFDDGQARRWLPEPLPSTSGTSLAWSSELANARRASGTGDHYAAIRREDDELVACLWAARTDWSAKVTEVSYAVAARARGFGFAAEATAALGVDLLLEQGLHRVELRVPPGNTPARRVAEKAGFTYEGLLRNAGFVHGGRVDLEVWSLVTADLRPGR